MHHMNLRDGGPDDLDATLALLDEAVAWLAAAGRTGQWGSEPFSADEARRDHFAELLATGTVRIAEDDGVAIGVAVLTPEPSPYVGAADVPELFVRLLCTSRRRSGSGVGRALVEDAERLAREAGVGRLRVDCYAGSQGALVRTYERLGFTVDDYFVVDREGQEPWPGCLLVRPVAQG